MSNQSERVPLTTDVCQKFWLAFFEDEQRLARLPMRDSVNEANELLERFFHGLVLEIQGIKNDPMEDTTEPATSDFDIPRRELIISADGLREYFPDLLLMASKAPSLRHYDIISFRSRTDEPSFPIIMDDFELSTDDVLIGYYPDRGLVGVEMKFNKAIPMNMIDHSRNMAMIMMDHVLGEFDFAVRVGSVNFVDEFSAEVVARVELPYLPQAFDQYWRETLGRNGQLDFMAEVGNWTMLKVGSRDDSSKNSDLTMPWIINVYDEAHRVATRADLGYRIEAKVIYENQEALDRARDLQEAWVAQLQKTQCALLVLTQVSMGSNQRSCTFYVDAPDLYLQNMRNLAEQHLFSDLELAVEYDPSWNTYFDFFPDQSAQEKTN